GTGRSANEHPARAPTRPPAGTSTRTRGDSSHSVAPSLTSPPATFGRTWKDLASPAGALRRTPAFTMTALVTLALGIGANTAIFSLVNAVMLRTLPVAAPEELVFVGHRNPSTGDDGVNLLSNPAWLQRVRQETGIFTGVAAYNIRDFKVASDEAVEQVVGQYTSGNYHSLIGVPMALGRGFANENDFAPGSSPI